MYDEARRHDHHHGVLRGDSQDPSDIELLKAEAHAIAQAQAHEVSASKKDHSSSACSGVGSSTSRKTHSPGGSSVSSTMSSISSISKSSPTKKVVK